MSRFTFRHEDELNGIVIDYQSNNLILEHILDNFKDFLNGVGFQLQGGTLQFIKDEEDIND
jgi:hypothetical protein